MPVVYNDGLVSWELLYIQHSSSYETNRKSHTAMHPQPSRVVPLLDWTAGEKTGHAVGAAVPRWHRGHRTHRHTSNHKQ